MQMPHYHIVEATEAVKPVLGKYFKEPERSGVLPFHLIKQYLKGTKVSEITLFVEMENVHVASRHQLILINSYSYIWEFGLA